MCIIWETASSTVFFLDSRSPKRIEHSNLKRPPRKMAENETLEGFKRNMSLLVQGIANGAFRSNLVFLVVVKVFSFFPPKNMTTLGFFVISALTLLWTCTDRNALTPEFVKLESWKEWVSSNSPAVTQAHVDHLVVTVSLQAARAVLRRRQLQVPGDYDAAVKILKWVDLGTIISLSFYWFKRQPHSCIYSPFVADGALTFVAQT